MRPTIPAEGQPTAELEQGLCKSVTGTVRGSVVHRDLVCLVVAAGVAVAWIEGLESAPRDAHMRLVQGAQQDLAMSLAISPDGKTMASCDPHGAVILRDMLNLQSVHTYTYSDKRQCVWSLSFSPNGRYLAMGGTRPGIVLLDLQAGCKELSLSPPIPKVRRVAFAPTGRLLAATSFDDGKIALCDPMLGKTLRVLSSPSIFLSIAFSPDGLTLATGGRDGNISLWDVASGARRLRLEGALGPVFSIAFSPDGTLLASTGTVGPQVKLWEAHTGRLINVIQGNQHATNSVAFSPDGKTLASGGNDSMLRLWDVATGRQRMYLDGRSVMLRNVAFSPDGRTLLATGNDDQIRLWDVAELTDDVSDAGRSGREADRSSSNNRPRFANCYSDSAPQPVYPLDSLHARPSGMCAWMDELN